MKKTIRIFSLILISSFLVLSVNPGTCLAKRQEYREELTDEYDLKPANNSYKKAIRYIKKGDGAFRKRPGEAVQQYSNAESYLIDTVHKLKELGYENNIDVSKEVEFCENLRRETHVKTNQARKMAKN